MCGLKPCDLPDCTWSQQFMRQCEGRMVMRMADQERKDYLKRVAEKRGQQNADAVLATARDEYRKERAKQAETES